MTDWILFIPYVWSDKRQAQEMPRLYAKRSKYTLTAQEMWLTGIERLRGPRADLDSICCQLSGRDRRHLAVLSDASNGSECAACDGIHTPAAVRVYK